MNTLSNSELQNLSKEEKEKIAWNMAFKTFLNQTACVFGLGLIGYLFYSVGSYINIVDIISNNIESIAMTIFYIFLFSLVVIGLHAHIDRIYKEKYKELFGGLETKGWISNKGVCPSAKRVSIEFRDGKKKWNIDPKTEDWDLDMKNPINEYLIKSMGE